MPALGAQRSAAAPDQFPFVKFASKSR